MPIGAFRLNTLSAASAVVASSITATGGNISFITSGGQSYKLHIFLGGITQNFVVSSITGNPTLDVILVGGGGAGGGTSGSAGGAGGGGGGGGQYISVSNITPAVQTYSITSGAGGTGVSANRGNTGGSSTGFGYTAVGGAGGGGYTTTSGANGGSAGGGGAYSMSGSPGTGTYAGGSGANDGSGHYAGGGGGGAGTAGGAGQATTPSKGGKAGDGANISSWFGSTFYIGAGGNGGGASAPTPAALGKGNYGSGGDGAYSGSTVEGSAGNAGAVLIRYQATPVSTLTSISATTSSTTSITVPATVQAGDLLIYSSTARNNTTTLPTTPTMTGWTNSINAATTSTVGMRQVVYHKIAVAGDASSTITNMSGTGATGTVLLVYRPNIPITAVSTNWGTGGQATSGTPTNQTLTMSGSYTGPFIGIANYASNATVSTRGSTTTATAESNVSTTFYVKRFEALNSSTTFANSTISMADYGTNAMSAVTFVVT